MKVKATITIPPDILKQAKLSAVKNDMKISEYIEKAIKEKLEKEKE